MCHSDWNVVVGATPNPLPVVLGHEGAGIVEATGRGDLRPPRGRPRRPLLASLVRALLLLPARARRSLRRGHGGHVRGTLPGGALRLSRDGEPLYHYSYLSTFAERCIVPESCCVRVRKDAPFDVAALVGCAVMTGFGAVVNRARVEPGSTVAIFGAGGVGLSAILGAVMAGARAIVAVDPVPFKRETALELGATHAVDPRADDVAEFLRGLTDGRGADYAFDTAGAPGVVAQAYGHGRGGEASSSPSGCRRSASPPTFPPRTSRARRRSSPAASTARAGRRSTCRSSSTSSWRAGSPSIALVTQDLRARRDQRGLRGDERGRGRARGDPLLSDVAERTLIGEGFAGSGPNAAHVNTVLGRKGGPVETAWATALATPRQGHIPFVVVLRPNMPVKPATLFVNKADVRDDRHAALTWGAAQAGVAQGVLAAVADGVIPADEVDDLVLVAAVWVDWAADDEEAGLHEQRLGDEGRPHRRGGGTPGARRSSRRCATSRRTPSSAGDHHRHHAPAAPLPARPSLPRRVGSRCLAETSRRRSSSSRPTRASSASARGTRWTASSATRTCSSAGIRSTLERHVRVLETITFHAGRYWPLEAALWDLAGKAAGAPVASLLGDAATAFPCTPRPASLAGPPSGPSRRSACASRGSARSRSGRQARGSRRASPPSRRFARAVGTDMEIMVDLNQGWRMPGDVSPLLGFSRPRDRRRPARAGRPLARGAACRRRHRGPRAPPRRTRACGSQAARWPGRRAQLDAYLDADALDVYQPDAVLAVGLRRTADLAARVRERGLWFTPHTWTNGIGLLANLHVAAGVGGGPFLELPFDPPGWTPERRDFMLAEPLVPAGDGTAGRAGSPRARLRARRGRAAAVRGRLSDAALRRPPAPLSARRSSRR